MSDTTNSGPGSGGAGPIIIRPGLNIERKVQAGAAVGALGTVACWVLEVSTGVPVPSYVVLAIDTVLVGLVQYFVSNAVQPPKP